jgi:Helix-turn-helix domain
MLKPLDYLRAIRAAPISDRPKLSAHAAKSVLVWLLSYANDDGTAFPSLERLSAVSGLSVATVSRAIVALRELGWITTSRASRTAVTVYSLHDPTTNHGAESPDAKSQDDRCDSSPGSVRPITMIGATSHHEQRSAHLSAHLSAHPSAGSGRRPVESGARSPARVRRPPIDRSRLPPPTEECVPMPVSLCEIIAEIGTGGRAKETA